MKSTTTTTRKRKSTKSMPLSVQSHFRQMLIQYHLKISVCLFLILFHATIIHSDFVFVDSFQLNSISPRTRKTLPFTFTNDNPYCGKSILEFQRCTNNMKRNSKNDLIRLYSTPANNNNHEEALPLSRKETKNATKKNNKNTSTQRKETIASKTILDVKRTNTATDLKQEQIRRSWEESYQLLKQYKEERGDCLVPYAYNENKKLGRWVHDQRRQAKKGKLKPEQKDKLDQIGFSWGARTDNWNFMLEQLKEFQQEFGHSNVEQQKYKSRKTLALWVMTQRKFKGILTNEQQSQLDELDFVWEDVKKARGDRQWEERFEALQDYQRIYGDTRVPQKSSHNNVNLGSWVFTQRRHYRQGILRKDREDRLNGINFIWKLRDINSTDYKKVNKNWMKNLEKLKDFKTIHNHTNVPQKYEEDPKLALWVKNQRTNYRLGTLKKSREEMLESIGFEWNPQEQAFEEQWMDQYQELVAFQNKYGHVDIPRSSHLNLYEWLYLQRILFASNKLESDRKDLLEKLGVDLNVGPGSGNIIED